jgi:DNA (cytosine-5)-methyltransferase 1
MSRGFRFADFFSGLGGFHLAAAKLGGRCVFACEIDPALRGLYKQNFGLEPSADIRGVKPESVPEHELLCAGFPCQPFSKAGAQTGWGDKVRGTVFWNIIETLKLRRPRLVILENVAHFVRHDSGNTYQKVRRALEELGYHVDYRQFSPHQFGVPQIRERIYMVASIASLSGFTWPTAETSLDEVSVHDVLDQYPSEAAPLSDNVVRCLKAWQKFLRLFPSHVKLPSFPIWSMEFGATYPHEYDSLSRVPLTRLRRSRGSFGRALSRMSRQEVYRNVPSYARGARAVFPHWKKLFIRQNREFFQEHRKLIEPWLPTIQTFPPSLQKLEWNCQGEERDIWKYVLQFRASGVRVKRANTSPSLVAMTTTQIPIIGWERRYMTARECARLQSMGELQSLPHGVAAISALGNAVNTRVVGKILEGLLKLLPDSHNIRMELERVSPLAAAAPRGVEESYSSMDAMR